MTALTLLAVALSCGSSYPERPPPPVYGDELTDTFPQFRGRVPRNLVMITIDTFRKDHFDRYGDLGLTPFMGSLAESGVVLDDFVQCSNWTYASVSCTLAGRYNWQAGMAPQLLKDLHSPWPEGTPFLAGYLQEAGFYTLLVSGNGWLSAKWGNTQGYDYWRQPSLGTAEGAYSDARWVLDYLQGRGYADRWFMHLHIVEPHAAYAPPAKYLDELADLPPAPWNLADRDQHYDQRDVYSALSPETQELLDQHLQARYRGEVRWVDDQIQRIWQDLQRDDLLDDALLLVWTDHGEAFWEHGYHTHAFTLHREENDAVAFFWANNIVPAVVDSPTTSIDLVPTLLKLWDIEIPEEVTGYPLGDAPPERPRFAWSVARLGAGQSVQRDGWKMIFPWRGSPRLYDTVADPDELVNLYDPANPPPEAKELWRELEPVVEAASEVTPSHPVVWPVELLTP